MFGRIAQQSGKGTKIRRKQHHAAFWVIKKGILPCGYDHCIRPELLESGDKHFFKDEPVIGYG
jgi:hypothetical protein